MNVKLPLAVEVASEVLDMHDELIALREEVQMLREYRKKYVELLESDIKHNAHMVGGLLSLAMTPGVLEAVSKSNQGTKEN